MNQVEGRNVYVIPELHNKGYTLFTKDKSVIELASLWVVYRELLDKESKTLASSRNERINWTNRQYLNEFKTISL